MPMTEQRDELYIKQLGKMQRPIPGQSLTNDPNNPLPFEGPPQFTKKKEALEELFGNMTKEEVYVPMMEGLMQGTPVMEMTQVILFEGFRRGMWNPDLFMMLAEPTAYMIMGLAERAGVDYRIDREDTEVDAQPVSEVEEKFNRIKKSIKPSKMKSGVLPKEIEKKIEEVPTESLLARPEQKEENPESLMSRPRSEDGY